ncbi:hypothetical protein VB715_00800 [Crocosphaera sp. UHCC 0190]|uniref:hypothetical protein n=1 Tax=Crocosphaera sp. UHCC 0190 TaxID=3110246 RepID=UPI002B207724|nr:hypothetical protein [Crocosphaera sp. UHCC 0190]MEA5508293.1 hypothetical protein [Crocosphaera sp. UHCC 0190]
MNSKSVQLLLALGLVTTLGACGGGGGDTPADSGTTGETTEQAAPDGAASPEAPASPDGAASPEGGEGGEG